MLSVKLVPRGVRPTAAEDQAVKVLSATLEPHGEHISRSVVRFFEEEAGDGAALIICRAKVTLAKALHVPSFLLEGHAATLREAAELVADAVAGAVRRALGKGKGRRGVEREATEGPPSPKKLRARRHSPGPVSAHPPRGRHFHMTGHQARATSARELSATHPSRKSTRKSANRSKRDGNVAARTGRAVRPVRPSARG